MWHMIEQDILARYLPGRGKLRACIVTDGDDCRACARQAEAAPSRSNDSPLRPTPLPRSLAARVSRSRRSEPDDDDAQGARLRRRVVHRSPCECGVRGAGPEQAATPPPPSRLAFQGNSISASDARTYRSLAHATGGEFLALRASGFNPSGADELRFLDALRVPADSSQQQIEDVRAQRQRQYELDARAGRADKFDWYVALPPPKKDS